MKIYIAASWKHRHAVEMLTDMLRERGHKVLSFVENCDKEGNAGGFNFEEWVHTPEANRCFYFDTHAAMTSDLVIYIGPSGKDAAVELGAAFACGVTILGLYAKGEDFGLMRKIFTQWYDCFRDLLAKVAALQVEKERFDAEQEARVK